MRPKASFTRGSPSTGSSSVSYLQNRTEALHQEGALSPKSALKHHPHSRHQVVLPKWPSTPLPKNLSPRISQRLSQVPDRGKMVTFEPKDETP